MKLLWDLQPSKPNNIFLGKAVICTLRRMGKPPYTCNELKSQPNEKIRDVFISMRTSGHIFISMRTSGHQRTMTNLMSVAYVHNRCRYQYSLYHPIKKLRVDACDNAEEYGYLSCLSIVWSDIFALSRCWDSQIMDPFQVLSSKAYTWILR